MADRSQSSLVLVGPAHPYRGGQALVEAHLFQMLTAMGFAVRTISFSRLYPSFLFPGTTQYDRSGHTHAGHADRIERLIDSVGPWTWWRAARRIRRLRPAAVVFVWWMPFFGPAYATMAWLVRRWTGARVVFLVENFVSHEQRWFDHALTRLTLRLAHEFIAESDFVADKLRAAFPATPVTRCTLPVYDCYNLRRFDRAGARAHLGIGAANVVLFFGYVRRYKGLDRLIEAFDDVLARHPDTHLLIVGECYEDRRAYDALIARCGHAGRTTFVAEYVANEDVEPYFAAADVVCLPYRSATQSGIVMLAYGFERPVVATRVGALPELIDHGRTGFLVEPDDREALAAGVVAALDARDRTDFAANIRAHTAGLGYRRLEGLFDGLRGGES